MGRPSKSVFRTQKWQRIERGSRTKSWPCPAHPLQQRQRQPISSARTLCLFFSLFFLIECSSLILQGPLPLLHRCTPESRSVWGFKRGRERERERERRRASQDGRRKGKAAARVPGPPHVFQAGSRRLRSVRVPGAEASFCAQARLGSDGLVHELRQHYRNEGQRDG